MSDLKILHLNTYEGNGGAGRACLRLSAALNEQGVESEVLVYFQFSPSQKTTPFSASFFYKIKAVFNILAERYLAKFFVKAVKTPFSLQFFGQSITNHPALKSADIIHLHWINHGFLTPKNIAELSKLNKPIVWTFHDSNAFTGGCHVRYACKNFLNECGNCPLLKNSQPNDLSHKNWTKKQQAYSKLNFNIVAPSYWMQNSIKKSSLLKANAISVIPNTIEVAVFKPYPKAEAKQLLGIPSNKFVLMSGFMPSKNDKHKGAQYLIEALELLAQNPMVEKENIELVIFGNKNTDNMPIFPFKTTFLGNINSDMQLAKSYSAADAFITPSLEDNLPNTVMESLACGTPVIAFETGGIPDMVEHLHNGYLAKYESATDLAEGIAWLYGYNSQLLIQVNARESVLKKFAPEVIAKKHIELYNSLLTKKMSPKISVITIVYNNVADIERTICSVLNQNYSNIEYIIIDGKSTDGTLEIIKKYENKISKIVSEPDKGIYDAMNKGLAMATGDYVLFMNSGDELYDFTTISNIFNEKVMADIYYGETEMYSPQWESLGRRRHQAPKNFTWKSFKYGMNVCHQAIYIKRSLTEPYNLTYKYSADIDWIIKAAKKAETIVKIEGYVAKYLVGGMSKQKHWESLKERFKILSFYYGWLPNVFNHVVIAFNLFFYYLKNRRTND